MNKKGPNQIRLIDQTSAAILVDSKKWGKFEIVIDSDMIDAVLPHRWFVLKDSNHEGAFRARATIGTPKLCMLLHHLVVGCPLNGMVVDHISRNTLDNRRANLRVVTQRRNNLNKKSRGTSFHKATGKWRARIKLDGVCTSLGLFQTEEEAHAAYWRAKKLRDSIVDGCSS